MGNDAEVKVIKPRRPRRRGGSRLAKHRAKKLVKRLSSPVRCAVHAFLLRYQSALRKVPSQLPPKVHAGPPTNRVKRVSWRDEDNGSLGIRDPAVLAVGPSRRPLTYTRDELMFLRNLPLVTQGLENAFAGNERLARVLKKRPDAPPGNSDKGPKGEDPLKNNKYRDCERRSSDSRECFRSESGPTTGVVVSSQLNSFSSGSAVPVPVAAPPPSRITKTRSDVPLFTHAPAPKTERAGRRIGSGRIILPEQLKDSDYFGDRNERQKRNEYNEWKEHNELYCPPRDRERVRDDRWTSDNREDKSRSGGRFIQQFFEKEDEPEWFSGGPKSQLETIELHGFDEPGKSERNTGDRWKNETVKDSGVERKSEKTVTVEPDFYLDDFLKFDSIAEVLTNGRSEAEGSRFSRWFRRDSPPPDRHTDILTRNVIDDFDTSTRELASNSKAPPASSPFLLELLRRTKAKSDPRSGLNTVSGKVYNLEDLEARLRPNQTAAHQGDRDLSAFKRLLAQVSGGHAVLAEPQRPQEPKMSGLQMLKKQQQQQQQQRLQQQQQRLQQQQQQQQQLKFAPHIPQELLYKILQMQQQQQRPYGDVGLGLQRKSELLQRQEAQVTHGKTSSMGVLKNLNPIRAPRLSYVCSTNL